MQRRLVAISLLASAVLLGTGCSSTGPIADPVSKRWSIDADVDNATAQLYAQVKGSRELVAKSRGVLVFPKVVFAGLVLAGSYGEGSLQAAGTKTYYSTGSASVGLTAGADSKAVFVLFLTDEALKKFQSSNGWTAGVDASVALATLGADGSVDTATAKSPVIGFVLTNGGLMANLSIEGTKINRMASSRPTCSPPISSSSSRSTASAAASRSSAHLPEDSGAQDSRRSTIATNSPSWCPAGT